MKLCRLKLKNLNSFREEIDIDFEDPLLADASLVAITGPTGAGKTTLLDAICVALYGKTPRLSGTGSQHPRHLISHGEKDGFAEVHFTANGTRYIASWSLRRGGAAAVRLSYAADNKLISDKLSGKGKALGSSQRTVSQEVESILGLDFDAFRRSVMLAQGEFAAFLKASREDRRTILEATAGIDIYELLKDTLNDKVNEVKAANAEVVDRLNKIPEASPEQLKGAETELDGLKSEAKTLETQSQEIQQEKDRETKRKEAYEKLQTSEERQTELLNLQPEIDALQAERESAERAKDLRSEKREYDTTKSEFEKAEEALSTATTEKKDAEERVKTYQVDFDEKEESYQTASTEHTEKAAIYTAAKLDVERASNQFAQAEKRTTELENLNSQIETLSDELTSKETKQIGLQKQIKDAQTFLDENPLPSDRQHRLTQANVLLAQLDSQQERLETALASEAEHGEKVSSLKREITELSKTREERLAEKANAETVLETATTELNKLLAVGNREKWTDQKQQASLAQPIAQRYEKVTKDLEDILERRNEVNDTVPTLTAELAQIEEKLREQTEACRYTTQTVERCEEALRSAMLTEPINQLRHRLHKGEPCPVCGATEHPFAGVMEPESEGLLQDAETALDDAKSEAQTAEAKRQDLKTKQIQAEQSTRNAFNQIREFAAEIEVLRDEIESVFREWQEIYPDADVSSDWVTEQIEEADVALAALAEAERVQTKASHAYDIVAQQLETCETDIAREEKFLNQAKKQLQDVKNTVAALQTDITSTVERFWEFLPEDFHGVTPDAALSQFNEKIEEVETCEDTLGSAKTQLKLLNAKIETDQGSLETLQNNRDDLQDEINEYRREGEAFLDSVREKTGGLETEDEIDTAIGALEAELQAKETERDAAEQRLQSSQNLLTQKQTAHEISEKHHKESHEKLETAQSAYFDKLADIGFNSPEAHDNAFRDDARLQQLTEQIEAHETEKQQLALEITRLKTRFEETPYDPEALESVETKLEEIGNAAARKAARNWCATAEN